MCARTCCPPGPVQTVLAEPAELVVARLPDDDLLHLAVAQVLGRTRDQVACLEVPVRCAIWKTRALE